MRKKKISMPIILNKLEACTNWSLSIQTRKVNAIS